MVAAAAVLCAAALSFTSPTMHVAPVRAVRTPAAAAPVYMMAGWNDPYDGGRSERGKLKTDIGSKSFDEQMKVPARHSAFFGHDSRIAFLRASNLSPPSFCSRRFLRRRTLPRWSR